MAASADERDRPGGWDVVIDATGNAQAIQDGLGRVAKGGTFLQFGVSDDATTAVIEPYRIYNQEITITGSGPRRSRLRPRPVEVVNTVGAGDAFMAGVLGWLASASWRLDLSCAETGAIRAHASQVAASVRAQAGTEPAVVAQA